MSKCAALEPAPTRFYAPLGLFAEKDLHQLSAEYLGEVIVSPGGSFRYRVISGPLCRLYWERSKPQPNVNESAYFRNSNGKGWMRSHPNFLSYQIADGSFITVRLAVASAADYWSYWCKFSSRLKKVSKIKK